MKGCSEKGFTLIELLVAMGIIAILIFCFTPLFIHSYSSIFSSGRKSNALFADQGEMEKKIAENTEGTGKSINLEFPVKAKNQTTKVWGREISSNQMRTFVSEPSSRIRFVAVGESGKIISSPDGNTWNQRSSGVTESLKSVHWGGPSEDKKYTAVGQNGTILSSGDGISWTKSPSYTINTLNDITWGGLEGQRKYVAVGSAGTILTSSDGKAWTMQNITFSKSPAPQLYGVVWGDVYVEGQTDPSDSSIYIAVGEKGTIITSKDGLNWTEQATNIQNDIKDILWSANQFVAIDNAGYIYRSGDGLTWDSLKIPNTMNQLSSICWGNGKYILAAKEGNLPAIYQMSLSDFLNPAFTKGQIDALTEDQIFSVTWGYNQFIAVGSNGIVWSSANGGTWSRTKPEGLNSKLNSVTSCDASI